MSERHDPAAELFTIAAEARARGNARRTEIDQEHQRTAPLSEVREAIAALQFYPGPSDSTPHSAGRDWVLLLQNLYESLEKARHLGLLEQLPDRGEGRRAVRCLLRLIGAGQCEKAAEFLSNIDAPVEYQGADGRPTWEGNLDWELARDLSRHLPEDLSALLPPEHPRKPPDVVPQAGASTPTDACDDYVLDAATVQTSPPEWLSQRPISPIAGELPPDLLAAFNSAVELATQAGEIDMVLRMPCGPNPPTQHCENLLSIVQAAETIINSLWQVGTAAIYAVTQELNATRDGRASFGQIVEPNAHLAALALASRVTQRLSLGRLIVGETSLPALARFFARDDPFPTSHDILAEAAIEASKAARAREICPASETLTPEKGTTPNAAPVAPAPYVATVKGTVNQRMLEALHDDPSRIGWTQRQWAVHLSCSPSAIAGAPAWGAILNARAVAEVERLNRRRDEHG